MRSSFKTLLLLYHLLLIGNSLIFTCTIFILAAIAFFVKLGMSYFDYRTRGQFEWTGPAILFVCLIFVLLAPNYIWGIIGI